MFLGFFFFFFKLGLVFLFNFFPTPCGLWDLSSLTRDWTQALPQQWKCWTPKPYHQGILMVGAILTMGIIEKWAKSLCIPNEMCGKNGFQKMADSLEKMLYFGSNPKLINWLHIVGQVFIYLLVIFICLFFCYGSTSWFHQIKGISHDRPLTF